MSVITFYENLNIGPRFYNGLFRNIPMIGLSKAANAICAHLYQLPSLPKHFGVKKGFNNGKQKITSLVRLLPHIFIFSFDDTSTKIHGM